MPLLGVERDALLEPFREPDWAYWSTVETAELWALVALVFRAEPYWTSRLVEFDSRAGQPGWVRDRFIRLPRLARLRDDRAFQQTLEAAVSWVHQRDLERLDLQGGEPARAVVTVASFVEVALARDWPVPIELGTRRCSRPQNSEGTPRSSPLRLNADSSMGADDDPLDEARKLVLKWKASAEDGKAALAKSYGSCRSLPTYRNGCIDPAKKVFCDAARVRGSTSPRELEDLYRALDALGELGPPQRRRDANDRPVEAVTGPRRGT